MALNPLPGRIVAVDRVRIFVVQERLDRILGFVLHGMAVYLDMKPSVETASTRLCCKIIISLCFYSTRYPNLCPALATACPTAVVSTR